MPRHVDDDRFVASLAGQAGTGTACQERRPGVGDEPGRRLHVGVVDREDHPERDLAVVGRVAGIGRPRRRVEADFPSESVGQRPPEGVLLSFS